eukprot:m.311276 g.311276  ORF g.311276 m.311276 type:complete len:329 (+) comp63907_c0_seq1:191-1177(+)
MAHLITWECAFCGCSISAKSAKYIHDVSECERTHDESLALASLQEKLAKAGTVISRTHEVAELSVSVLKVAGKTSVKVGKKLAQTGGKTAAKVGSKAIKLGGKAAKAGKLATKGLGRIAPVIGVALDVMDIVGAAKEEAPPLPVCKLCGIPDIQQLGCRVVCGRCGVACSSYTEGSKSAHCCMVCQSCYDFQTCMVCREPAIIRKHRADFKVKVHRPLETRLYDTHKAGNITGSSLSIAGTAASFIPVIGWIVGPALIVSGMTTNIVSSATAKNTVKVICTSCNKTDPEPSESESGCQEWCYLCNVPWDNTSKWCLSLCDTCTEEDFE